MSLNTRIEHIVKELHKLIDECLPDKKTKIDYLTLFAQDDEDYEELNSELSKLGERHAANNGNRYVLHNPLLIEDEMISLVRVRKSDIHRKEDGCADISVSDMSYNELRELALEKGWDIILRKTFEMIELSTFDINIYAYIVEMSH